MSGDAPRLYLITPPLTETDRFAVDFAAALRGGAVACVHLRLAPGADAIAVAKTLVPIAQQNGAACLLSDVEMAGRLGADGVHIDMPALELDAALKLMKPKHIVGVGGLATRDDAMHAGESGADYLMFGGPDQSITPPQICERIVWWAEIFNVPCVAYAHALADISEMVAAGADFVAVEAAAWCDPRGPEAAVADAAARLAARCVNA